MNVPNALHRPVDVSVLVTTYRRPRHLALALESLALQRCDTTMEVVVSDDGSNDETPQVVRAFAAAAPFPVRFTSQPHDGFRLARVRNEAARLATGRYLMFLDGDCVAFRHHVAAHVERRRHGTALLGYCARLPATADRLLVPENLAITDLHSLVPSSEWRALARRRRKAWWHAITRHPTKPRLAGGDFGVWRDDFERVNGFDERFVGWGQEDDDLGLRLRASGIRLETILDRTQSLHVWHPVDSTATPRWRDGSNVAYFKRRGRLTTCRRGLKPRPAAAVTWGLPPDLHDTPLGRLVAAELAGAMLVGPNEPCEIELVVRPGTGRFTRRAECRLAIVAEGLRPPSYIEDSADDVATVADATDVIAALAAAG
jgi:glycosyltransferase involved in cell wall biosynthesis